MNWLTVTVCLLVSFLFNGIETGLLTLNRVRLLSRAKAGEAAAVRLNRLLSQPERLFATVLLVTNLADVAALVLVADALVSRLGSPRGYWAALLLFWPVQLLVVQWLSKAWFRRFPYRTLTALAGLLEWTAQLLGPLLQAGRFLARRTLWRVGPGAATRRKRIPTVAREELKRLAAEGERAGTLTGAERRMIDAVLDFRLLGTRDLMRPLPPAFLAGAGATVGDALGFAAGRGADVILVVTAPAREAEEGGPAAGAGAGVGSGGRDRAADGPRRASEVAGLLEVFALLLEREPRRLLAGSLRPPMEVTPEAPARQVVRRLRTANAPFAVVTERDLAVGVVYTEDLLQRLVRGTVSAAGVT